MHIAIMSHLSHYRELSTKKVQDAIHRLKQEGGVIIRSQSPVMAGINDDARVWNKKWKEEVRLGIIPYYMFIARDTGAQAYFNVPLVRAQKLYSEAIRSTSGLCRTARGPSMSCTPGKVEVVGVQEVQGTEAFVLRFLQCRDDEWIGKVFFREVRPQSHLVRRPRAAAGHVAALGGGGPAAALRRRALPGRVDGRVPGAGVPAGGCLEVLVKRYVFTLSPR